MVDREVEKWDGMGWDESENACVSLSIYRQMGCCCIICR